ncbi:hypothetical protein HMPREF9440_01136 [Sutterella parvirubra YIT 11816]|uniref:Uncharacterized protein n=1 Tax=Sutterella parvirubra YIT 11816 TaxID=762967 RepID=H3KEH2_9BURK|nr:hypothetical protein HMPREF9440_01136 [Sutterella parvirubra YIT 11816]
MGVVNGREESGRDGGFAPVRGTSAFVEPKFSKRTPARSLRAAKRTARICKERRLGDAMGAMGRDGTL